MSKKLSKKARQKKQQVLSDLMMEVIEDLRKYFQQKQKAYATINARDKKKDEPQK